MPEPIAESVEVAPSAENGNIPAEAPNEQPKLDTPVTPTEQKEPVTPTEPVAELYELPDGRKVDASTLTKEWKENFLPDYTRKSQELAKVKNPETAQIDNPTNPLADPNWTPSSYAELIEIAKNEMKTDLQKTEQAKLEAQQAIENEVVNQLTEIRKLDPNLNENALFQHATKYSFRDLRLAFQNMKDMNEMAKTVQKKTVENINKRSDPVSTQPGAIGVRQDPSQFANARDYLRSITN